jgi:YVTN family beta-propeller protein
MRRKLGCRATLTAMALLSAAGPLRGAEPPGWLLVANKNDQALGIVDPVTNRQVANVPVGGVTGHEVIASPDGTRAYVPIYGNAGVGRPGSDGRALAVVDLTSRTVVSTLDFGHGVRPHHPLIGPKDGLLYVTAELDDAVSVIDPKTMKIVGSVPTGQKESHMLAITRDGKRGYTANVGVGTGVGSVSVLDLEKRATVTVIPISKMTQRISLSVDDKLVFTSDQVEPRLVAINTATNTVERTLTLPAPGYGTAPTEDGRWLVVPMPKANKVAIVDLKAWKVEHVLDVPKAPQFALVRPDGKIAYVSCDASGQVAAIRTSDWKVETLITAGQYADGLAWAAARPGR